MSMVPHRQHSSSIELWRVVNKEQKVEVAQRVRVRRLENVAREKGSAAASTIQHLMDEGSNTIDHARTLVDGDPAKAAFLAKMADRLTSTLDGVASRFDRELDSI